MTANGRRAGLIVSALVGYGFADVAVAQTPTRDLSDYSSPSINFVVEITLNAPAGTAAVAMEDAPPADWSVSNISNSGTWDAQSKSVKWGPFFDPGIPATVSYDITPTGIGAVSCFSGAVSFDGADAPIGGDECVGDLVPAASSWGLALMMLFLLVAATLLLSRRKRDCGGPP